MKYYNSYEEAKAAYPDCDAVLFGNSTYLPCECVGKFIPVKLFKYGYDDIAGNDGNPYHIGWHWSIATPSDHEKTDSSSNFKVMKHNYSADGSIASVELTDMGECKVKVVDTGVKIMRKVTGDEARLYAMLDDIDILGDQIKPTTLDGYKAYFEAVNQCANKRHLLYANDGYEIFNKGLNDDEPQPKRTKVVYEDVEFKFDYEAVKAVECDGVELFTTNSDGEYIDITSKQMALVNVGNLYCKVTKKIYWQEEVAVFIGDNAIQHPEINDGFDFEVNGEALTKESFIAMCHLVAELTDKPE